MKTAYDDGRAASSLGGRSPRHPACGGDRAVYHHEHWDGNGYPEGRSGEAIPLAARLVMVADVFDALTSDRVYRAAWPVAEVLSYIQAYAGQRFDPAIAALCKKPAVRRGLIDIRGESGSKLGSVGRQNRELRLG